ncbi:bifunctional diguanylate cyclase/phosphodiesterase [Vibrio cyclitrophicus]|uniref:EAL domain-containing protein n=1 Tax=Vibrio cyclitrophicus ZF270 TaxID=1136176 RepID=A0AAN0M0I2_9VIBR|nr:EAL domain-containing protein [Vibrio cyclitrophicus]OBT13108.1 diguanylate cyclase [Vibrio cyclitrophicus]OCH44816.1 diguanylate cyclase [Vibrio cyclitrophicus]OED65793.1 diguanylate cyclase [Vibrio cyclitrophicus ZF99]OEE03872.1 diguanylate cyclase [Vibrio cyclitrophicus ZF264]PME19156.1 diguanylate cyclase [Vibrio cyclitrophicus]
MQTFTFLANTEELFKSQFNLREWSDNKQYLIQLFSAQSSDVARGIASIALKRLNRATLIGQSARHVICDNCLESTCTLIIISEFNETRLSTAVQPFTGNPSHDSQALTAQLNLSEDTKTVISLCDQVEGRDYPIYNAFENLPYALPVAGGLCHENEFGRWVMHNEEIYQHACVAVALSNPKLKVWSDAYSEWNPIGMKLRVTRAEGHRLYALNDKPAIEVFKHYLADGKDLPFSQLMSFPLYRELGRKKGISTPLRINDDGSIEFDSPWHVGEEAQFCYNHPSLTAEKVRHGAEMLAIHQPESVIIYNCVSRLEFIDSKLELKPFEGIVNTCGAYCMGELYRNEDRQEILHHSLTYIAMRESDEIDEFRCGGYQRDSTVSPLLNLVRNAVADLDSMNIQMEEKLHQQARRLTESYRIDSRTGLPNRIVLKERLNMILFTEHLLTLKLTNFHQVNEKYGYQVGDQLLQDLSNYFVERLHLRVVKESKVKVELFSIGVGEWAIIFNASVDSTKIEQRFVEFADDIEHTNFEPYGLTDIDYLSVSLCGGFASRCDFLSDSGDQILLKAIEARRYGVRNNTHITNAKNIQVSEEDRKEQLGWLSCVSRAILDQNIITYSQPIVAAGTHEMIAQECLVRIMESDGSIIPPGKFLPIIADTHLYTRLSRHMIKSTIGYMADKQSSFSINLSPQDLLSDKTLEVLEAAISGMNDPTRLGLEVLESEQIKDYGRMIEVCDHFRALGTRIIVDDFGSGYSNIDEIIKLEPQVIKLDGSLIRNIDKDEKQRNITSQLVRLCQVFNAKTVAEFVHNQQVCDIAEQMGVDYLQGYHFGEPKRLF